MESQGLNSDEIARYNSILKEEEVYVLFTDIPKSIGIYTIDISLMLQKAKHGQYLILRNKFLYDYVREGLTYVQYERNLEICRRGLKKSFELKPQFLKTIKEVNGALENIDEKSNKAIITFIFGSLKQELQSGKKISIYAVEKNKGNLVHISYIESGNCWSISTGLDTILARDKSQLGLYIQKEKRHRDINLAVAICWFELLEKLESKVQALKELLKDKTLIGEFVGHPRFVQSLTNHKKSLIFSTLVNKIGEEITIKTKDAHKLIIDHGLSVGHGVFDLGQYDSFDKMIDGLDENFKKLYSIGISQVEEGFLLVFENDTHQLMNLTIETFETKIYSFLRKEFGIIEKKNKVKRLAEFEKELKNLKALLIEEIDTSVYIDLWKGLMEFIFNLKDLGRKIATSFKFSDLVKLVQEFGTNIPEEAILKIKQEYLDAELDKDENFESIIALLSPNMYFNSDEPNTNNIDSYKKVIGLIPIGLPGMGKTTITNILNNSFNPEKVKTTILSQDLRRQEILQQLIIENPDTPEKDLFQEATHKLFPIYHQAITDSILSSEVMSQNCHIILLDKGHAWKTLDLSVFKFRNPEFIKKFDIKAIVVRPYCKTKFKYKEVIYPFSLTFIFTCLSRAFSRTHDTLIGDDVKKAGVLLKFLALYENYEGDDETILKHGAVQVLNVPFSNEETDFESKIPANVVESLGELLLKPMREDNDQNVAEFLKIYNSANLDVPVQDLEVTKTFVYESISKLLG